MITARELAELRQDDLVETYPLFPGLAPKRLVALKVVKVDKGEVDFVAVWMGVTLGRWNAKVVDNVVKWVIK